MGITTHSIEVNAPLRAVYNQWTQFEEFPRFMEGVEEVRQLDQRHLHWVAKAGGKKKDEDLAWRDSLPDDTRERLSDEALAVLHDDDDARV